MEAKEVYWEDLIKVANELFKRGIVEHSRYAPSDVAFLFSEEMARKTKENLAKELHEIFKVVGFLKADQFGMGELVNGDVFLGRK